MQEGRRSDYQHILYEVGNKIATITLNRPDRMNAWTAVMEPDVREAMIAAAKDDDVRVIVLTGAGRPSVPAPTWRRSSPSIPTPCVAPTMCRPST